MPDANSVSHLTEIDFDFDPLTLLAADPSRYPALLESAASGTPQGRYDILFAFPQESRDAREPGRFLDDFDAWWRATGALTAAPPEVPFHGGWFVMLGYELAAEIEPSLRLGNGGHLPVAIAMRVPLAVVRDRLLRRAWIVAEPGHDEKVAAMRADLAAAGEPVLAMGQVLDGPLAEEPADVFLRGVEGLQRHIAAGDIFQANLSREWRGQLAAGVGPAQLHARLRQANPAPFAGLAVFGQFAVASSSPERLLCRSGQCIETRPIAGTRPRLAPDDAEEDVRQELLRHPKERAEHVMLIDLERNDLGRVCEAGSVEVNEFMVVESYRHVHHIVSNVRGKPRAGITPGQAIRAVFPGGTITGCPKVRCMQLIHDFEQRPRGFYTGSMGYINRDGSADLNILIRTMVVSDRDVSVAAGSGIVADSDPAAELEETRAKAKGMLLALQ